MALDNRVIIVTGGGSGIGRATANRLAKDGAKVVVADIDDKAGAKVVDDLKAAGKPALFVGVDIAERLNIHNLLAATLEEFGQVDGLVNNAALMDTGDFLTLPVDEYERVLRVSLTAPFILSQAVAKLMVEQVSAGQKPGAIVNITSVNAEFALADHVAYSVAKGGLKQLTKAMALSLAPHGIRVNAVGPGTVRTPMVKAVLSDEASEARILSRTPLGRFGRPSEIAAIVAFLLSDEASYITGTTVYADGGRLALNYTVPVKEKR